MSLQLVQQLAERARQVVEDLLVQHLHRPHVATPTRAVGVAHDDVVDGRRHRAGKIGCLAGEQRVALALEHRERESAWESLAGSSLR